MKKLILLSFLLLAAMSLKAQTNYYPNKSGTITKSGYTYKYENRYGDIILYNSDNRFGPGVAWAMKDGSPISIDVQYGRIPLTEDDDWIRPKAFSIFALAMLAKQH